MRRSARAARRARRLLAGLTLAATLLVPGVASADVRAGTVDDGLDQQDTTPTLVPREPEQELVTAAATYDRATGRIDVSAAFNVVGATASFRLAGKDTCRAAELDAYRGRNLDDVPMLSVGVAAGSDVEPPSAWASLEGYDGVIEGTSQVAATAVSGAVAHPAFADRDYRCVIGIADNRRVDFFFFYFDGHAPTPSGAPRLICNDGWLEDGHFAASRVRPRRCSIWLEGWSHAQSATFIKATWRDWGSPAAHGRATLTYNMGFRKRVSVRAYRLRPDCTDWRWIYTRVAITLNGRTSVYRTDTCPTV